MSKSTSFSRLRAGTKSLGASLCAARAYPMNYPRFVRKTPDNPTAVQRCAAEGLTLCTWILSRYVSLSGFALRAMRCAIGLAGRVVGVQFAAADGAGAGHVLARLRRFRVVPAFTSAGGYGGERAGRPARRRRAGPAHARRSPAPRRARLFAPR